MGQGPRARDQGQGPFSNFPPSTFPLVACPNGRPRFCFQSVLEAWIPLRYVRCVPTAHLLLPHSPRRGTLLVCSSVGNAGGLPTALVVALLAQPLVPQGVLFVQLYCASWRVLLWSVGPALLGASVVPAALSPLHEHPRRLVLVLVSVSAAMAMLLVALLKLRAAVALRRDPPGEAAVRDYLDADYGSW